MKRGKIEGDPRGVYGRKQGERNETPHPPERTGHFNTRDSGRAGVLRRS